MSIGSWLCKLWSWIMKLLDTIIESAVTLVTKIAKATITILGDIADAAGDVISDLLGGGVGQVVVLGVGAYLLWSFMKSREKKAENTEMARLAAELKVANRNLRKQEA